MQISRQTIIAVAVAVVAVAGLAAGCPGGGNGEGGKAVTALDTVPALIMQVQKCSRLYTAEYDIRKIITHSDEPRLKGRVLGHDVDVKMPVGDRKIAIPISVKLKAYIDFGGFSEANVRRDGSKITIILPDPKVELTGSRIDQQGIREYVSLTRSHFTDKEMAEFESQGRKAVIETVPDLDIIATARDNAARIIIPMVMGLGYDESDVTVTFRKDFSRNDIFNMIEKKNE